MAGLAFGRRGTDDRHRPGGEEAGEAVAEFGGRADAGWVTEGLSMTLTSSAVALIVVRQQRIDVDGLVVVCRLDPEARKGLQGVDDPLEVAPAPLGSRLTAGSP